MRKRLNQTQTEVPYPNRKYWLANLLAGKSFMAITKECTAFNLDVPNGPTLAAYQQFIEGLKFNIAAPDFDMLMEHNLYHLTVYYLLDHPDFKATPPIPPIGVEGALRILEDAHMRKIITALSLANMQNEDIDLLVNARYNHEYDPEEIRLHMIYFCDFEPFSILEKKDYVDHIPDRILKKNYSYAFSNDKNMLLWKLGLAPDKSFDAMLRDIGVDCYYNYKEQLSYNDQTEAQKWASLLLKVQERIEKLDETDGNKNDLFQSFVFQIQSQKANTNILPPEEIMLDMPISETPDARKEIISIEELEQATHAATVTLKETSKEDNSGFTQ